MFSGITSAAIITEATTWAASWEAIALVAIGLGVARMVTRFVVRLMK